MDVDQGQHLRGMVMHGWSMLLCVVLSHGSVRADEHSMSAHMEVSFLSFSATCMESMNTPRIAT